MFSGGALERLSIFAMGVMPYISASIIVQMMSMVLPSFVEIRKEGESGRRRLSQITRYGTLALGAVQSFAAAMALQNGGMALGGGGWQFLFTATVTMTTGTMFLMWLGEQMTERGVGNGISMLILAGIVAGLPGAVGRTDEAVNTGEMSGPFALLLVILIVGVTAFCVYVERAQRRITVNYAKRQVGRRMYAGQSTLLPFKLNLSGVFPPIFASSLLLFPATVASFAGTGTSAAASVLQRVAAALGYGQPLHLVLYAGLILFFCFFYTALVFNARDTADNLKKQGAFIPGIRPASRPATTSTRCSPASRCGAIYVTSVCLLPEILTARRACHSSSVALRC